MLADLALSQGPRKTVLCLSRNLWLIDVLTLRVHMACVSVSKCVLFIRAPVGLD